MSSIIEAQIRNAEREWLESWRRGPTRYRWNQLPLQVGDPAPDVVLLDLSGDEFCLRDTWRDGPALIIFLRHFGCSCAVDRADRLQEEYANYADLGATVLAIGQGEPERSALFAQRRGLPCLLLCDPTRRAYEAYDLLEARPAQVAYGLPDAFCAATMTWQLNYSKPVTAPPWRRSIAPGNYPESLLLTMKGLFGWRTALSSVLTLLIPRC